MGQRVCASTQYGDLHGTISIDGWDGLVVIGLGGTCGKGYWPVAIDIDQELERRGREFDPSICVLAVDESILEGRGPDAIRKYAKEHGELPVFRFATKLKLKDLLPQIKRLSIVLQDRSTEYAKLMLAGGDNIYEPKIDG